MKEMTDYEAFAEENPDHVAVRQVAHLRSALNGWSWELEREKLAHQSYREGVRDAARQCSGPTPGGGLRGLWRRIAGAQ